MKISFNRTNAPLLILDEDGETIGCIKPRWSRRFGPPCSECGQAVEKDHVIIGYGLQIKGRYWGEEGLKPKGRGGFTDCHIKTLKAAKALAVESLK